MNKNLIYINSYPKSGNNYIKYIIYSSLKGKFITSEEVTNFIPNIHSLDEEDHQSLVNSNELKFIKSHHPYTEDLPLINYVNKCIYLVRNPLDILISRKNHYLTDGLEKLATEKGVEQFLNNELRVADSKASSNRISGGWNNHVISWLFENRHIPIFIIKYEDLIHSPMDTLTKMFDFLDIEVAPITIECALEQCSIGNMKKLELFELTNKIEGQFYSEKRLEMYRKLGVSRVNKGRVGEHKRLLDISMQEKALEVYKTGMKLVGYV